MTMTRDHILVAHQKFPAPLKRALSDRGLTLIENEHHPDPEILKRTLACIVDFGGGAKHPLRARRWKNLMSRHGIPVCVWNRDAPHNNNLKPWRLAVFNRMHTIDIYATHSLVDTRWHFSDTVLFLPNAADTASYNLRGTPGDVFARLRDSNQYRWDVSFFGAIDATQYKEAKIRQQFFSALSARLRAQNIRHNFVDTTHKGLPLEEQVDLIQSSHINLNFGARCDYGGFPPSGLPERCFGIPACGGFLLTDRRTHTRDSFEIGRHLDEFYDINDCVHKIQHHLLNFNHCRIIAEEGWHHVMQLHTYANRAEALHLALIAWHGKYYQ